LHHALADEQHHRQVAGHKAATRRELELRSAGQLQIDQESRSVGH
jgi:hypothetical protein